MAVWCRCRTLAALAGCACLLQRPRELLQQPLLVLAPIFCVSCSSLVCCCIGTAQHHRVTARRWKQGDWKIAGTSNDGAALISIYPAGSGGKIAADPLPAGTGLGLTAPAAPSTLWTFSVRLELCVKILSWNISELCFTR